MTWNDWRRWACTLFSGAQNPAEPVESHFKLEAQLDRVAGVN